MANTLQLIKTVTADGNSATMDSGTLTGDLDVLRVVIEIVGGGSGGCRMRFNGNTGNNYRRLFSENGGSKDGHNDGAGNGVTNMVGRVGRHCYSTTTIYNYDGKESHGHGHCVTDGANTGSANAPTRMEYAFKWAETDQINRIAIESYSSNWTSGSTMNIYAFSRTDVDISNEKDALTNVPVNTRYEETDTRKIYRAKSGTTWEQTTQSTWWNMYENVYYGVKLGSSSSQVGETISSVDMYLKASSSSEASTVQVIRGTSVIGESASVAGSTITSSGGWITFSFSTGVSLQASDYILFKRTNPAAITNGSEIFAGSASSTDNDLTTYWSNNPLSLNLSSGVLPTMRIITEEGITWKERGTA